MDLAVHVIARAESSRGAVVSRDLARDAVIALLGRSVSAGQLRAGEPHASHPRVGDTTREAAVGIRSVCRHCGGNHGALHVTLADGEPPLFVSVSRAPGLVVAAATHLGPIGIDLESIERMRRSPVDDVALAPDELAELAELPAEARDRERTIVWTRKEALLKATGHGLRITPSSVSLGGLGGGAVTLREAPADVLAEAAHARFESIDVATLAAARHLDHRDLVATVCVL